MLDLVLAYAHHLAVFAVVGLLFAEFVLLRPGLDGRRALQLAGLDGAYGAAATLVFVAGALRVAFGDAGWSFYAANPVFWVKIGLFVVVGLLSIAPTIAILRWRRAANADSSYSVPEAEIRSARRFLHLELGVLALIPLAAAAMARGFGL
jgi:putative membrane protein